MNERIKGGVLHGRKKNLFRMFFLYPILSVTGCGNPSQGNGPAPDVLGELDSDWHLHPGLRIAARHRMDE